MRVVISARAVICIRVITSASAVSCTHGYGLNFNTL